MASPEQASSPKEERVYWKRLLDDYIALGGFPEVLTQKADGLLTQYFSDILYRDLIAGRSLRNVKEIKELCLFLASNNGAIHSYESLRKAIGATNVTTIKNYLEALEEVYLFFKLPFFDYSVKKQIYNPGKYFSVDTGLARETGFQFSSNAGHFYEHAVFLELKRQGREIYYWKSPAGVEVDFVVKTGRKIQSAIQVCLNADDPQTRAREMAGLLAANECLSPEKLVLITEFEEGEEPMGNTTVQIVPLWKYLQ
jgi:hypothetical protein